MLERLFITVIQDLRSSKGWKGVGSKQETESASGISVEGTNFRAEAERSRDL